MSCPAMWHTDTKERQRENILQFRSSGLASALWGTKGSEFCISQEMGEGYNTVLGKKKVRKHSL